MALTLANSQGTSSAGATNRVITYAATPTAGNLLLLSIQWRGDPGVYVVLTPELAGYTLIHIDVSGTAAGALYYRWATGGEPATSTITWTNSVPCGMSYLEYTWSGTASEFDLADEEAAQVSGSVTASTTKSITPTVNDSVVFAVFNPDLGNSWDVGSATYSNSFVEDYRRENANPAVYLAQKDLATAASTSTTFDASADAGGAIYNVIAAFRQEAAAGGTWPHNPLGHVLSGPFGGPIG